MKAKRRGVVVTEEAWDLRLFIVDNQPRSTAAIKNLKHVCETYLANRCNVEVVDLAIHPEMAKIEQIVVIPTLQKLNPRPQKILVGDFSVEANVLRGLGIEQKE